MDEEAFAKRTIEVLEEEAGEPLGWWWLSFADDNGFRGVVIVKGRGIVGATAAAHLLGINPGGEVRGVGPAPFHVDPMWVNRLLTREECAAFDREYMAKVAHKSTSGPA